MGRNIVTGKQSRSSEPRARSHSESGWTLIELVVVMSIITVLAAMAMTVHRNGVLVSKESVLKTDLFRMRDAIDQYYADKQRYPADLQALVTDGYLRAVPVDPMTNSADTWQTTPAEPDAGNPSAEPGIYNVKSGAEGTSLQGTPYTEF